MEFCARNLHCSAATHTRRRMVMLRMADRYRNGHSHPDIASCNWSHPGCAADRRPLGWRRAGQRCSGRPRRRRRHGEASGALKSTIFQPPALELAHDGARASQARMGYGKLKLKLESWRAIASWSCCVGGQAVKSLAKLEACPKHHGSTAH